MAFYRGKYRIESARLEGFDYGSPGSYFVTINVKRMICWFGDVVDGQMELSEIGKIVADEWQKTPRVRNNVTIDEFVVMPNHMHGIVMIHESKSAALSGQIPFVDWERSMDVMSIVETHSRASLRDGGDKPPTKIPIPNRFGPQRNNLASIIRGFKSAATKRIYAAGYTQFAWQPRYHDRIIRDESELDRIREYIINNPINWNSDGRNLMKGGGMKS